MTLQSEDMGKLVAGREITVTDATGVSGPGVITDVTDKGSIHVDVRFPHVDSTGDRTVQYNWFFTAEDIERGGDYGLTLTFEPFRPAHREAQPETDGGGAVLWGCADGNGVDERLVYRDKSRADGAALSLGLTVVPLYAQPTPEGQTEGAMEPRMASVVSMLERVVGPTDSVRIYAHEAKLILAALASKGV